MPPLPKSRISSPAVPSSAHTTSALTPSTKWSKLSILDSRITTAKLSKSPPCRIRATATMSGMGSNAVSITTMAMVVAQHARSLMHRMRRAFGMDCTFIFWFSRTLYRRSLLRSGRNVCIYFLLDQCKFGEAKCIYSHKEALPSVGWWTSEEQIAKVKSVLEVTEKKTRE